MGQRGSLVHRTGTELTQLQQPKAKAREMECGSRQAVIGQGRVRGMGGSALEGVGEHGSRRKLADWGENKYGKKGSNSNKAPGKAETKK